MFRTEIAANHWKTALWNKQKKKNTHNPIRIRRIRPSNWITPTASKNQVWNYCRAFKGDMGIVCLRCNLIWLNLLRFGLNYLKFTAFLSGSILMILCIILDWLLFVDYNFYNASQFFVASLFREHRFFKCDFGLYFLQNYVMISTFAVIQLNLLLYHCELGIGICMCVRNAVAKKEGNTKKNIQALRFPYFIIRK